MQSFFTADVNNTIGIDDNKKFAYRGPWIRLGEGALIDSFFLGDFSSAEYTVSIELDSDNKEIIKCLVVAGLEKADIVIYGRASTRAELVDISARVNRSFVEVTAIPKSTRVQEAKMVYTGQLFKTQIPL